MTDDGSQADDGSQVTDDRARAPRPGRTVLVTGANSGIGLSTALELAGAGYRVVGTVRSAAKGRALSDAAERAGRADRVSPVVWDVSDPGAAAVDGGWAAVLEAGGAPWAVVNNAGYAQAGAVEDVGDEAARAQLETNLLAPARVARLALPAMREAGEGRVVNVGSVAGRVPLPIMGWYCASKAGLAAVSDVLRMELAPHGVQVVLVEPGSFGTSVWSTGGAGLPPEPATESYRRAYASAARAESAAAVLPDPVWVARVVRAALASPVPLPRYLVGVDAVALSTVEAVTPSLLSDYAKSLATGLRRVPLVGRLRR